MPALVKESSPRGELYSEVIALLEPLVGGPSFKLRINKENSWPYPWLRDLGGHSIRRGYDQRRYPYYYLRVRTREEELTSAARAVAEKYEVFVLGWAQKVPRRRDPRSTFRGEFQWRHHCSSIFPGCKTAETPEGLFEILQVLVRGETYTYEYSSYRGDIRVSVTLA